jgi:predicted enzyme related to lactoylglutathione lyase
MAHGEINHIEFPADDVERAKAFYVAVAGWEFSAMDGLPEYWLFRTSEGYGGATPDLRPNLTPEPSCSRLMLIQRPEQPTVLS